MSRDRFNPQPPPRSPLDRFTRAREPDAAPAMWVFMCGCRRIVRRDGPKVAICLPEEGRCHDTGGHGRLATDAELEAEGLDPAAW